MSTSSGVLVNENREVDFLHEIGSRIAAAEPPHEVVGRDVEFISAGANSELSEQLGTRKAVERAKGILQRDLQLSEEEAYLTLQRQSRQMRKSMREIAEAIVLSEEIKRAQGKPGTA